MLSKKMLKRISLVSAVVLGVVSSLTGCGGTKQVEASSNSSDSGKTGVGEKVKIVYGGWEGELMINELAEKFMELHPDIEVEIFNNGKWLGNEEMAKLAATGQMPDIINLENPTVPVQNDWVIDMKPYLEADPESDLLYDNFVKYGTAGEQVVMLPSAVFLQGIMVNKDLLAANNIAIPDYNWTVDEFVNVVKQTSKKGVSVGTNGINELMKHIPPQMNDELGWGTFNEVTKQYELGEEWIYAADLATELYNAQVSVYEHLDANGKPTDYAENSQERTDVETKRKAFLQELVGEEEPADIWYKGKAATWLDFSWATTFYQNPNYAGFDWDFYPFPVVEAGDVSRPGIVVDSLGVTSTCENPEAAFEFVKFLTYSKEGHNARIDIVKNYDKDALKAKYPDIPELNFTEPLSYNQMPAIDDEEVRTSWLELNNAKPGLGHVMANMGTGYADGFKVTPGFDEAYHNIIEETVKTQIYTNQKTASDLANELETKANEVTTKAYEALQK